MLGQTNAKGRSDLIIGDIKTMAQAVANKGWACISNKKILTKTNNPTVYNDINNKYDNAERGIINTNTTQNYAFDLFENDNKIYFCSNYDYKINNTTNIDLSGATEVVDLKSIFDTTFNDDIDVSKVCKGTNVILAFGLNFNNNCFILKLDFSFNVLKSYKPNISTDGKIKCYSVLGKFIYSINFGIYWDNDDNSNIALNELSNSQAINALTYDSNSGDVYIQLKNVYNGNDGLAYTNISNLSLSTVKSLPENTINSDVCYFNDNLYFMCNANGTLVAFKSTNNGTNWVSINNNIESISGKPIIAIFSNKAYIQISSGNLYSTTNFIVFAVEIENTNNSDGYSSIFISNLGYYATSNSYNTRDLNDVVYADVGTKVFTDTYSINGNSISIDYYKNSSSQTKIVLGTSQNTNIDTITAYLGYNPYFVLDTTTNSENVQLPINTNLWTYMFVGDNYEDSNLPTGNTTRLLPQTEIITNNSASVSLDIKGNKTYDLTNSALTTLTINSCEDSPLGTLIKFHSGTTATTIDDTNNSGIDWTDGAAPIPSASKTCWILIVDKTGFYKEW